MAPLRVPPNPFDRWARSESGLHLPSRLVPRAVRRLHHIEKFGQCQSCCGGSLVSCDGCQWPTDILVTLSGFSGDSFLCDLDDCTAFNNTWTLNGPPGGGYSSPGSLNGYWAGYPCAWILFFDCGEFLESSVPCNMYYIAMGVAQSPSPRMEVSIMPCVPTEGVIGIRLVDSLNDRSTCADLDGYSFTAQNYLEYTCVDQDITVTVEFP